MDPSLYRQMAETQQHHWWFAARRYILERLLKRLVHAPVSILEIGCGPGGNLALLSGFGKVCAVEMDEYAMGEARKAAPQAEIRFGWLPDNMPFGERRFELVCLFDVLEHVEDDQGALNCVFRMVEQGGVVLLTVPAFQWLFGAHDQAHHHFRRYTAGRLRLLAERAGFRVKRLGYFNTLLFPLVVALRLTAKLGHGRSADSAMPTPPLNRLLFRIFAAEAWVAARMFFPFGVSAIAVLEKP
jgi:SAM-dependent methyltransferase